ncbi:MAG: efflux RND transporter periplasmic adaptor subunit [candidate division KSB1 bacterium]|nr:efflux RND transporter periplasmic adaptor subunit [candidate division KSB1 bacterium]MDZ7275295.1 efflux RND transporter periplasmic adaptor subunit [candidate division KSB1 bacterium]MDZ7287463.1 efflux RND transporter periplasmic adaptor subunit [candidate division KSB1 bacterium]MDZ7299577.1 efflux RND transporter periplasmic adaptor subunit [candidate division KSB1 bacterium]MDZ7307329.1 efflux RND transporter periplasmic adaptor subunit [candidate division KSB1 bacterium]
MNKKQKRVWWLLAGSALLAALTLPKLVGSQGRNRGGGSNGSVDAARDSRLPVRMEIIHAERMGDRVQTVGTILANEEVEIRSEIAGKIEKIYFREGARVNKGELLLKINDTELQAQLARARFRQAIAEQEAERQRQLFEKNLTSRENYDNAVNELNIVKAEIQLITAQIAKTEIRAPFAGSIGLRRVSEGSYISPASVITTLQDNHPVKIDFTVPEKYAGQITIGAPISFSVQGSTQKFEGTIYAQEAKIDPATHTMHLRALSPNPDGVLLPGAFANVEVVLREKETLMVPAFAVIPELKGHRVFLYKNGRAESRSVTIGTRTDERVEITDGVQPGDTLITSGILQLRPGMAVRPAESGSASAN